MLLSQPVNIAQASIDFGRCEHIYLQVTYVAGKVVSFGRIETDLRAIAI